MEENKSKIYASSIASFGYEETKRLLDKIKHTDGPIYEISSVEDLDVFYEKCLEYFPEYLEELDKEKL